MPGMNWDRVRREEQATQDRSERLEANSPRVSFAAKYRSTCTTCTTAIDVGDRVASTMVDGKRVYHHERCIYSSGGGALPDGRCHGTTKAGKPCAGGAKQDELYCGPHLDKMARDASASPSTPSTDAPAAATSATYDPYYDDPF